MVTSELVLLLSAARCIMLPPNPVETRPKPAPKVNTAGEHLQKKTTAVPSISCQQSEGSVHPIAGFYLLPDFGVSRCSESVVEVGSSEVRYLPLSGRCGRVDLLTTF